MNSVQEQKLYYYAHYTTPRTKKQHKQNLHNSCLLILRKTRQKRMDSTHMYGHPLITQYCTKLVGRENKKEVSNRLLLFSSGNVLLSRAVTRQVSKTLKSLTTVFGMGTGGTSLLSSPNIVCCCTLKTEQYQISNESYLYFISFLNAFQETWTSPRPISTA